MWNKLGFSTVDGTISIFSVHHRGWQSLFWRLLGWNSKGLNWKTKKLRVPSFLDWGDKGTASRVTWMFKGGYRLGIPQQILLVRRPAESKGYPWAPANTTGRGTFLFSSCGGEIWKVCTWLIHTYPHLSRWLFQRLFVGCSTPMFKGILATPPKATPPPRN